MPGNRPSSSSGSDLEQSRRWFAEHSGCNMERQADVTGQPCAVVGRQSDRHTLIIGRFSRGFGRSFRKAKELHLAAALAFLCGTQAT